MKTNDKCPKCGSTDILIIPGKCASGVGNAIQVGFTIIGAVPVTRYLCGACGFSEEWIDEIENIEKIRMKYQ